MQMPVWVGIFLAIIFLTVFSEWAFHTFAGWKEIVLDDIYYGYRIAGITLFSIFVMSSSFLAMAYVTECPNETREGVFEKLNCEQYKKIRMSLGMKEPVDEFLNPNLEE